MLKSLQRFIVLVLKGGGIQRISAVYVGDVLYDVVAVVGFNDLRTCMWAMYCRCL